VKDEPEALMPIFNATAAARPWKKQPVGYLYYTTSTTVPFIRPTHLAVVKDVGEDRAVSHTQVELVFQPVPLCIV